MKIAKITANKGTSADFTPVGFLWAGFALAYFGLKIIIRASFV
jgi:hypothetical protein